MVVGGTVRAGFGLGQREVVVHDLLGQQAQFDVVLLGLPAQQIERGVVILGGELLRAEVHKAGKGKKRLPMRPRSL